MTRTEAVDKFLIRALPCAWQRDIARLMLTDQNLLQLPARRQGLVSVRRAVARFKAFEATRSWPA